MRFLNHRDMALTLLKHRRKLPDQIDLVVGVPRSGMIPASMLATQLNILMVDADGFLEGRTFRHGNTKPAPDHALAAADDRVVLIIDDVIGSGRAIRELKAAVAARGVRGTIVYAAVWGTVHKHPDVDVVLEVVDQAPAFPWNLMHRPELADACVDIDGVLCANPEGHESFAGKAYDRFLENAKQLHCTSGKIGWLVTSRLEQHRAVTEAWLERNGVLWDHLVMATPADKADSPAYKARVYQETGASLFIESEEADAAIIANLAGKPVICIGTLEMVFPGDPAAMASLRRSDPTAWRRRKSALKLRLRGLIGDGPYHAAKRLFRSVFRSATILPLMAIAFAGMSAEFA